MIIEAMKRIKDLMRKCEDLRGMVKKHSAHLSIDNPEYTEPEKKIKKWVDQHHDYLKEIMQLKARISKTNIHTKVKIEIGGNVIEHTITEWIKRRDQLAELDDAMYRCLTDAGLEEGKFKPRKLDDDKEIEVKIIRNYDPEHRDKKRDEYQSEPLLIDSRLEVINATTELLELD